MSFEDLNWSVAIKYFRFLCCSTANRCSSASRLLLSASAFRKILSICPTAIDSASPSRRTLFLFYLVESFSVWRAGSSSLNDVAACLGRATRDNELAAESGAHKEEESLFPLAAVCGFNLLVFKRNKSHPFYPCFSESVTHFI